MRLFPVLLLVLLTSCASTQSARANLETQVLELRASYDELAAAGAAGATAEELAELDAEIMAKMADVKAAAEGVSAAVLEDVAALKDGGAGRLGYGHGAVGGAIGLGLTALAWFLRDRRKRKGTDPLQRHDVPTPPTTDAAHYMAPQPPSG